MSPPPDCVANLLDALLADPLTGLDQIVRHHPPPEFGPLEALLRSRYPALGSPCYPAVIVRLYQHVLPAADCQLVRLEPSPGGDPLAGLAGAVLDSWYPPTIAGQGLLAVASDGSDGGPLCADLRAAPPDEAPIVLWDHDDGSISEPLYDNAEALLNCAAHLCRGGPVSGLTQHGGSGAARYYHWWDEPG